MTAETVGVGIVGCGYRGVNTLAARIAESAGRTGFRIAALCDERPDRLEESGKYVTGWFRDRGIEANPKLYAGYRQLVEDPGVELVLVTTPQCAHKAPALAALQADKRLYVDKPIAHNLEDSIAITEAAAEAGVPVMIGFTRRYETPWRKAFDLVRQGRIGPLHMIQIRDVIPFHTYFHRWHRRRKWSGGALNDKTSHHFDVLNWFARGRADKLSAFGGRRVFRAEEDSPARCSECERDCPYRVRPTRGRQISQEELIVEGDAWSNATEEFHRVDNCVYLPGADINDHAVIQVHYNNGILGQLLISFFGPKAEDQETMELIGTSGRIILCRHTGTLDVISEYGKSHERIDCKKENFGSSHFGADARLIEELREVFDGMSPPVAASEGCEATRMVMVALKAIDSGGATLCMDDFPDVKC